MNQHNAGLVHDDVLAKMDALLKKHHDALARGSVTEDFPVLTEVVEEAEEVIPVLTEVVEIESDHMPAADFEAGGDDQFATPDEDERHVLQDIPAGFDDNAAQSVEMEDTPVSEFCQIEPSQPKQEPFALSGEALEQLDRRILEMLEQRLPSHIVEAVDKALPVVLEEFAMELESMVRDAVAQEIRQQLTDLLRQGGRGDTTE